MVGESIQNINMYNYTTIGINIDQYSHDEIDT